MSCSFLLHNEIYKQKNDPFQSENQYHKSVSRCNLEVCYTRTLKKLLLAMVWYNTVVFQPGAYKFPKSDILPDTSVNKSGQMILTVRLVDINLLHTVQSLG